MKSAPLVIASICSSPSWGGMEMQTVIGAEALARRGHRVILFTAKRTPIEREAKARGLETIPILPSGSRAYAARYLSPVLARHLRRRKVRIAHTEFSRDLWLLVPAALLANGVPVILTKRHASNVNKKDPLHRFLHKHTARVIAISSAVEEDFLKRTTLPPEKIVRIPNGIDLDRFRVDPGAREETRREMGAPPDAPVAGLVGRISRGKGHPDFLRAAVRVAAEFPEARFWIVGSMTRGEERYDAEARRLAAESGLGDRILFTGFREDVPRVLAALDVLVVPSSSEALGNVVLEGMAAGLPVAATGAAGILDLIEDGETGLLFPPGDPEAIAGAMIRLFRDREEARGMGRRARERARNKFDREKRTDRIEALYAEVLRERDAGRFRRSRAESARRGGER